MSAENHHVLSKLLTDETCDEIIFVLDDCARNVCSYELGLPVGCDTKNMRKLIRDVLQKRAAE